MPLKGAVIIAPIHFSTLDPPAYSCGMIRQTRFMAKEELFKGWYGRFIYSIGAYPVKRGENDSSAIRNTIAMLENGQGVVIFPEGSRGDGVHLGKINKGIALIAKKTNCPVIPAAINGTQAMWPKGAKRMKRQHLTVVFGEPFRYSDISAEGKVTAEMFAQYLSDRLIDLSHKTGLPLIPTPNQIEISTSESEIKIGEKARQLT